MKSALDDIDGHGSPSHRVPYQAMPALDQLKEQVAYMKFWQGVMVVTNISLVGWLISTEGASSRVTVILAIVAVAFLTVGIALLHRNIDRYINRIGKL